MYCTHTRRTNGTGPEKSRMPDSIHGFGQAAVSGRLADDWCDKCPYCQSTRLCTTGAEICCTNCSAVLGREYYLQEAPLVSKLNLYQATEIGTASVDLECARHVRENTDASQLSNACVKLDLPLYAAQEASMIFKKIAGKKLQDRKEYIAKRLKLEGLAEMGLATDENIQHLKADRPRSSTKAYIAIYAIFFACREYCLPKTTEEITDAVQMNFGTKRTFTMLKTCLRNDAMAQDLGIKYDCDSVRYYARLLLRGLQEKIGAGSLYNRIERYTFENIPYITDRRDDIKAQRALNLAIENIRLCVQV